MSLFQTISAKRYLILKHLDRKDEDGRIRKPDSLFMEGVKLE